ncbi:hypothetical protein HDU98_003474, partial [Podochytrium sp. JEL0797]
FIDQNCLSTFANQRNCATVSPSSSVLSSALASSSSSVVAAAGTASSTVATSAIVASAAATSTVVNSAASAAASSTVVSSAVAASAASSSSAIITSAAAISSAAPASATSTAANLSPNADCVTITQAFPTVQLNIDCFNISPNATYPVGASGQRRRASTDFLAFQNGHLIQVILANLGLQGTIPPILGNLGQMMVLDLSGNSLVGAIPPQLASCTNLQQIDLQNNQLTGTIPAALTQLFATNGVTVSLGTNCLANSNNQRASCHKQGIDCLSISLDNGYMGPEYEPLWAALAASGGDLNAFDEVAAAQAYFGYAEYMYQAFRMYASERISCMLAFPGVPFGTDALAPRGVMRSLALRKHKAWSGVLPRKKEKEEEDVEAGEEFVRREARGLDAIPALRGAVRTAPPPVLLRMGYFEGDERMLVGGVEYEYDDEGWAEVVVPPRGVVDFEESPSKVAKRAKNALQQEETSEWVHVVLPAGPNGGGGEQEEEDEWLEGEVDIGEAVRHYQEMMMSQRSFAPEVMRLLNALESAAIDAFLMSPQGGFSLHQLMELAGLSVASCVFRLAGPSARVAIVCGPGTPSSPPRMNLIINNQTIRNNGGDGLVAARHLKHFGLSPIVVYPKPINRDPFLGLITQLEALGIPIVPAMSDERVIASPWLVDAVFGFSFKGEVRPPFDQVLESIRSSKAKVISVDIPSGWDVETGPVAGDAWQPYALVSLTAPKLCAQFFKGRHFVGGRFVPPKVQKEFQIEIPEYEGTEQVVEIPNAFSQ